jgi:hypothetical protein
MPVGGVRRASELCEVLQGPRDCLSKTDLWVLALPRDLTQKSQAKLCSGHVSSSPDHFFIYVLSLIMYLMFAQLPYLSRRG